MLEAIEGLNRNTIAKENGSPIDFNSIDFFVEAVLEHGNRSMLGSQRMRLEWASCFSDMRGDLKERVEQEKMQMDTQMTMGIGEMETPKIR